MGEADECPSSSFFLPFLLLPTPLLPNLQISPLNEKVKEETNFHFERDVLERNTKSGKGRTKLPKVKENNTDTFPPITEDMLRRRTSTGKETINPEDERNLGQNVHQENKYEDKGFEKMAKNSNDAMGSFNNMEGGQ